MTSKGRSPSAACRSDVMQRASICAVTFLLLIVPGASLQLFEGGNSSTVNSTVNGNIPENQVVNVFYNVYNADDKLTQEIVEEQLATLVHTGMMSRVSNIFIMLIGRYLHIPNCPKCKVLAHHAAGSEALSLQALQSHCQKNPSERAVYIHDKGSYHNVPANTILRQFLTKGVSSNECWNMPRECNVCSARFSPVPHHHTPGNMWVARCEYVNKLMPIGDHANIFDAAMDQAIATATVALPWNVGDFANYGRKRWASEHWIHSHPSVTPCDVYDGAYKWGYDGVPVVDWKPILHVGPRFPLPDYFIFGSIPFSTLTAWRIHEWLSLYHQLPPPTSLWWSFYNMQALNRLF